MSFTWGVDTSVAHWFHQRLTADLAGGCEALSFPGSGWGIGLVLGLVVAAFAWRRHWIGLAWLVLVVPGGMLCGELIKLLVHRQRPYVVGPFVDWSGYSFPSGHTIGATLLYGVLVMLTLRVIERRRWRLLVRATGCAMVGAVGFSRVALGAHYVSDVVGAMMLGALWLWGCSVILDRMQRRRGVC